jgi:hypothetical protein
MSFTMEERVRSQRRRIISKRWCEWYGHGGGIERVDYIYDSNVAFRRRNEEGWQEKCSDQERG